MSELRDRTESVFAAAVALPDMAERAALLDSECADDPRLRNRIEALLRAHDQAGHLLDRPAAKLLLSDETQDGRDESAAPLEATMTSDSGATTDFRIAPGPGAVIADRYTLREKIGEGGMGEVWVAKQSEPVKRRVALKLIKAGMDSKAVLQRFEQERQALALMDHPNIARVFDAGMTAAGQPFFVMELVNGLPLDRFCDEAKLSLPERLELFVPICQAVQHAHQKGIVHRDLKPANVLVTRIDGKPVPKVIDFGVAKAFSGKLTEETMTQFGAVVGTLAYMSPEQAAFSGDDVDTRADIYSLGVMLYELLTGLRPIDQQRLENAALTEMIRIIREEEPSKPSTRLSTDAALPSLAAVRKCDPRKLTSLLRGELDWVIMKCLEKNRDRRYETANSLVRDIQRYLTDEPVEARPPSAAYRMRKLLKRNKGPATAAALVLLTLVIGIVGTTWGLLEAKQQEDLAEERRQEAETAKIAEAKRAEGEAKERRRAQSAEKSAVKAEGETRKKADELKHQLGISRMILANTAFDQNDVSLTAEWLNRVPSAQQGWAWRYLKQQAEGGLFTLRGHRFWISQVAYSSDGQKLVTAGGSFVGDRSAEVNVWDARTGRLLIALQDVPRSTGGRISVAFSPDGKKIVAAGSVTRKRVRLPDNTFRDEVVSSPLKVWDVQTGKILFELRKDIESKIVSVAFSPDGKRFATGGYADEGETLTSVQVWDAEKASKPLLEFPGFTNAVTSLVFSPDGKRLATLVENRTVRIWDAGKGGKPLLDLKGIGRGTLSFSPDGKRIVTGGRDGTAVVLDAETGKILLRLEGQLRGANSGAVKPQIECVAFSPDGSRIVTGGGTDGDFTGHSTRRGDIAIWNAQTGELLHQFRGHRWLVMSVSFSPDGEQILSGSNDRTAKVWDARTGSGRLNWNGHTNSVLGVAVSPDGSRIVTGAGDMKDATRIRFSPQLPGEAAMWDARTGRVLFRLNGFKGSVNCVAFSPDGKRFVTAGLGPRKKYEPVNPRGIVQASSRFLHTGVATVRDVQTGRPLFELKGLRQGVNSVAFSRDGKRIVTAGFTDWLQLAGSLKGTELKIWNAETGELVHDLTDPTESKFGMPPGHRGGCAVFSPNGRWIVAGGVRRVNAKKMTFSNWANFVSVWNSETGQLVRQIDSNSGPMTSVAVSPDNRWIVSGHRYPMAKVWSLQDGKLRMELKGHQGVVTSVAFSPDGQQIITGSTDRTVRVWDVQTGTALAVLQASMANVTSVAFSRDGKTIVAGGGEIGQPGKVIVWKPHLDPTVDSKMETVGGKPDPTEVAYRDFCTRPKPERYRENYLTARLAGGTTPDEVAQNEFAARFYLNLVASDDRAALVAKGDAALLTAVLADLTKRAKTLRRPGSASLAVPVLIRIVAIRSEKSGRAHLDTLKAMMLLGRTYRQSNQIDKSIEVFKELRKLSEAKHGRNHLQTMQAIAHLGASYLKSGDKDKLKQAIPLLEEAHRSLKKHPQLSAEDPESPWYNPDTPLPWVSLQLLEALVKTGETKRLNTLIKELSERIRAKHPHHPLTQITLLSRLAESLLKLDAVTEAGRVLRKCLTMLKEQKDNQRNQQGRNQLARTVEQLAQKIEAAGRKDDADRWRQELQTVRPPAAAQKASRKLPEGVKRPSEKTPNP